MIENKIIGYLEAGVRSEGLRQKAIASNVANMGTPGYRRVDVKFADEIAKAIEMGDVKPEEVEAKLYVPRTSPVNEKGNDVDIDIEIGEMVKNTMLQKAYMRIMAQKYRHMELAVGGVSGT